jgi:hypothetical protein
LLQREQHTPGALRASYFEPRSRNADPLDGASDEVEQATFHPLI